MNRGSAIAGYKDLLACQQARQLVKTVYCISSTWPSDERFGLTNQVRRAVVSIPSNIAEGQGRFGTKEFSRHLSIAHGSLFELENQLILASDLSYLDASTLEITLAQISDCGRLIRGLIKSLRLAD